MLAVRRDHKHATVWSEGADLCRCGVGTSGRRGLLCYPKRVSAIVKDFKTCLPRPSLILGDFSLGKHQGPAEGRGLSKLDGVARTPTSKWVVRCHMYSTAGGVDRGLNMGNDFCLPPCVGLEVTICSDSPHNIIYG